MIEVARRDIRAAIVAALDKRGVKFADARSRIVITGTADETAVITAIVEEIVIASTTTRIVPDSTPADMFEYRTVSCSQCKEWIRYVRPNVITDRPNDRRYIVCPGCQHERVLAMGGIK